MARKSAGASGAPVVAPGRAVELLRRQLNQFEEVSGLPADDPGVRKWLSTTAGLLEAALGESCLAAREFRRPYAGPMLRDSERDRERAHRERMGERRAVVESCIEQLQMLDPGTGDRGLQGSEALGTVRRICERFHRVAQQLTERRQNRTTLYIDDEYDVQDLLHALLRLHFDDVRTEEWAPSYAGCASRMDFLLKREGIVIEVKMARLSLSAREAAEQLMVDAARYRGHPDCRTLVCFVYDPKGMIRNPEGVAADIGRMSAPGLEVVCVIGP